jgi:hypothetical protein
MKILGVGSVISSVYITSVASLTSVSPTSIGLYGGVLLSINGNGFSSDVSVIIGTSSCTVTSVSVSQIQCTAPAKGNNASPAIIYITSNNVAFPTTLSLTYNPSITPIISSISPTIGSASDVLTITGSNFVNGQTSVSIGNVPCTINSVSSTSIMCTVNSSPAGNQSVIVQVTSVGQSNSNINFVYSLQLTNVTPSEGSYGGGQSLTIRGDGFNGSNVDVTVCNQLCQSVSIVSNTQLICVTPSSTVSVSDTTCNVIVTVGGLSETSSFVYRNSLTATVTSVNPGRGGTGGGTTLTVTGTNFP